MQTTSERRLQHSARIAYGLPIALSHEGFHEPFEAECVDLSPGGLSLRSSCLPGVGETLTCHFDAPSAGQRVEVRGEVVWAHLEGHRGGEFGVRFLDVDPTTIALISEMIGEGEARQRREQPVSDDVATAKLAVDGTADTFTARLLRRSSGLVTFEQELSFLKLGRGVSAYQGNDVQRGEIASVAVRLDGGTPKLMVTLRYEPSEAPDDEHTRDEAVTAPQVEPISDEPEISVAPISASLGHDTVPDLVAPVREPTGKHAVTLTEFDAAYQARESQDSVLPTMSTRSEFDLPSAIDEAESMRPALALNADEAQDDEDPGPALFTADEMPAPAATVVAAQVSARVIDPQSDAVGTVVNAGQDVPEEDDDARYEAAAARVLGERAATIASVANAVDTEDDAGVGATVDRCDAAVMFKVDESDQDFRPPTAPSPLTIVLSHVLSLWTAVRSFAAAWLAHFQLNVMPKLQARGEALLQRLGPQVGGAWTRVRERSLPMLRSWTLRAVDGARGLARRVGGQAHRRRTTGIPMPAAQTAPTVNRRSQVAAAPERRKGHVVWIAAAAVIGLGLAGYALFSAPDPHVVPVHREITAAPSASTAVSQPPALAPAAPAIALQPAVAVTAPVVSEPVPAPVQLPPAAALPAPSYEAGRIAAPSYPTIERAAPAPKPVAAAVASAVVNEPIAAQEGTGAAVIESTVITSNAGASTKRFGASTVRGRHFTLQMSAPVKGVVGTADAGGFSVILEGALSLDRAGPIAASHGAVARAMILNKGDRAELTIRFKDGLSPKYQVIAKGDLIEITIEE